MLQEFGWLSVNARIKYNKDVLAFKALNRMTPGSEVIKNPSSTRLNMKFQLLRNIKISRNSAFYYFFFWGGGG